MGAPPALEAPWSWEVQGGRKQKYRKLLIIITITLSTANQLP